MRLLQIYPQYMEHNEARIVGNRSALEHLRDIINEALQKGAAETSDGPDCIWARDGEGYHVEVKVGPDDWDGWEGDDYKPYYQIYDRPQEE